MDGGNPRLSSTTVVAVTVRRNLAAPVFRQARYDTTIPETQTPGSLVLTIQADDSDISVRLSIGLLNSFQSYNTGEFRMVWSFISVGAFTLHKHEELPLNINWQDEAMNLVHLCR